jgi:hypothetical protein
MPGSQVAIQGTANLRCADISHAGNRNRGRCWAEARDGEAPGVAAQQVAPKGRPGGQYARLQKGAPIDRRANSIVLHCTSGRLEAAYSRICLGPRDEE